MRKEDPLRTQREVGRYFGLDHHAVAAIVDLHGLRPRKHATALVITEEEFQKIAPDLRRIRARRDEKKLEGVA
jgi:hypothetical protein